MAAVCSVGTTPFDVEGFKKKLTFLPVVVAFPLNINHLSFQLIAQV